MAINRIDISIKKFNKRESFLETYIQNTLNEIKEYVKKVLVLDSIQEEITDKKMSVVLRELIDANFKNVNVDGYGNLVHTLLPLTDSKENDKIRRTLILYYTALYNDNIDLLNKMLKEEINFGYELHNLNLYYLDKDITSKFEEDEYFQVIKDCGKLLDNFNFTTRDLPKKRKGYVIRFTNILKGRHADLITHYPYSNFYYLFTKKNLDIFEDASYYYGTKEQLQMMANCGDSFNNIKNEETIRRLNNLIQTTAFKEYFYNFDLMFGLFNDEELQEMDLWDGHFFYSFSHTPEMLNKVIDLFKKNRRATKLTERITTKTFMEIDNDTLIKIYDSVDFMPNEEWIKLKASTISPKSFIKILIKRK